MTNIMNKIIAFIGGVIIIFLVIILVQVNNTNEKLNKQINELEMDIYSLKNSIAYLQSSIANQISQINNQIEENSKLYYNNNYDIIEYNPETDITTINYHLYLKNYGSNDKVFLTFKNGDDINKVEMGNDNSYFNVNIEIESKKAYELTVVIEGDRIETQSIGNLEIYKTLKNRIHLSYPMISVIHYGGDDRATATMSFYFENNYKENDKLKITSGKVTAAINDNTIIDINNFFPLVNDYNNSQTLNIDKSFNYQEKGLNDEEIKEDIITYSIEMVDVYGFVYSWSSSENKD